jgi:hypothetical protein
VLCIMHICIRCDVLEKDEDVVGRTRDQRRVCGGAGQRECLSLTYSMQAFALAIVVHYTASRSARQLC